MTGPRGKRSGRGSFSFSPTPSVRNGKQPNARNKRKTPGRPFASVSSRGRTREAKEPPARLTEMKRPVQIVPLAPYTKQLLHIRNRWKPFFSTLRSENFEIQRSPKMVASIKTIKKNKHAATSSKHFETGNCNDERQKCSLKSYKFGKSGKTTGNTILYI